MRRDFGFVQRGRFAVAEAEERESSAAGHSLRHFLAMQNVICSGWLLKTGGDGHNYKNTKKRWFELKVRPRSAGYKVVTVPL